MSANSSLVTLFSLSFPTNHPKFLALTIEAGFSIYKFFDTEYLSSIKCYDQTNSHLY